MSDSHEPELLTEARSLVAAAESRLASVSTRDEWAELRAELFGKRGRLKALKKRIAELPREDRRHTGAAINALATALEQTLDRRRAELEAEAAAGAPDPHFDPTWPGVVRERGTLHPVSLLLDQARRIFARLGFDEASGPELEDAWHNFDALNIPPNHPAREPTDQFYVEGGGLLRSQTSTVQIRVMESRKPPLRIFAPGRVYRPETVDATHLYAFHQVEGLMVGPDVTFVDLKACLLTFVRSLFHGDVEVRFRPNYFPFTEVSAELDVRRPDGSWMEVLGCGMVHPAVFEAVGYDPEEVTGFAFGMGLERLAMQRWKLDDIRLLEENDVRFLRQFA